MTMTVGLSTQIALDERGVAWIVGANTKVKEIVLDRVAHGWSPEEIHFQHRHLSLAQIHAALAYYYEHQGQFDEEIQCDLIPRRLAREHCAAFGTASSPVSHQAAALSVRFYADVHVPFAISVELQVRGVDILTAQADRTTQLDDPALLARATDLARVLFTQDDDLLRVANAWQQHGTLFGGVVEAITRVSIGQCVADRS